MTPPDAQASEGAVGEVPEWARKKARELLDAGDPRGIGYGHKQLAAWIETTFARYIAAHEQPPVDPLRAAIDDAWPTIQLRGVRPEIVFEELRARLPAAAVAAVEGENGCG